MFRFMAGNGQGTDVPERAPDSAFPAGQDQPGSDDFGRTGFRFQQFIPQSRPVQRTAGLPVYASFPVSPVVRHADQERRDDAGFRGR